MFIYYGSEWLLDKEISVFYGVAETVDGSNKATLTTSEAEKRNFQCRFGNTDADSLFNCDIEEITIDTTKNHT